MRIETKPLQSADTNNNDDDTPTYLEADIQRSVGIPRAVAKVHYITTKTTKIYIHYENVLSRVATTSAAASSSILYPNKTLPTTSSDSKSRQARRQTPVVCCSAAGRMEGSSPRRTRIIYTQLKREQSNYTEQLWAKNITNNKKQKELCKGGVRKEEDEKPDLRSSVAVSSTAWCR